MHQMIWDLSIRDLRFGHIVDEMICFAVMDFFFFLIGFNGINF